MYLGWSFCGETLRSKEYATFEAGFSLTSNAAICLRIESLIMMVDGEKLNDAPEELGVGLLQLIAQHNWTALTLSAPLQSITFFLQHSIADIPFSAPPEKTGVPANTPPTSAKNRKMEVSLLFILKLTILISAKSVKFIPIFVGNAQLKARKSNFRVFQGFNLP